MDVRGHIEFGKYNEGRSLYTKSGSSEEYSVVEYAYNNSLPFGGVIKLLVLSLNDAVVILDFDKVENRLVQLGAPHSGCPTQLNWVEYTQAKGEFLSSCTHLTVFKYFA